MPYSGRRLRPSNLPEPTDLHATPTLELPHAPGVRKAAAGKAGPGLSDLEHASDLAWAASGMGQVRSSLLRSLLVSRP
jgi:hypothetical protein